MTKRKREKPVKVLIAVVHPELDPTRDADRSQFGFDKNRALSGEDQWKQEGPILKVARKILTTEDMGTACVFLLYTRLSTEGIRRREQRISGGIPGPRVPFDQAEERAKLTQLYLKNYLKVPENNIRLRPLDFDDENASNITDWLKTIRQSFENIRKELSKEKELLRFEFNFVYSGAPQAREVVMGCLIGGVMLPSKAKLWAAPDPTRVPLRQERSFKYEIDFFSLTLSPPQLEQEKAKQYTLAIFNYGDAINVYVQGKPLKLGNRRANKKAQLLYELALARKEEKYTSATKGISRNAIRMGVGDDYKSKLRILVNKAVKAHTASSGAPIAELIKGGKEWYLDLPPEEIYV